MNKKFSTLVASILLASSVGAYAQITTPIDLKITASAVTTELVDAYDTATKTGGYEVGKAYFLSDGSDNYLYASETNGKVSLELRNFSTFASLTSANNALWVVAKINAPAGAIAPQYTFVNKATNAVLALDKSQAIAAKFAADGTIENQTEIEKGSSILGGGQTEWLSAPSYKDPTVSAPVYASIANDNVIVLMKGAAVSGSTTDFKVVLASMPASKVATATVKIAPYIPAAAAKTFVLTPNELNTLVGAAGTTATKDNFFQLAFSPAATMKGEANLLAQDLQAVAVQQYDLVYGEKNDSKKVNIPAGTTASIYASLHPATSKTIGKEDGSVGDKYEDLVNSANEDAVSATTINVAGTEYGQWVALRNRAGEYLVVDTAYIDGTSQGANKRISFKMDKLYNTKEISRFRDPRSYLFRFNYNPVTSNVEIQSYAYVSGKAAKEVAKLGDVTARPEMINPGLYMAGYKDQPLWAGSEWYSSESENVIKYAYVAKASLNTVNEVTMTVATGTPAVGTGAPTVDENTFSIKLGNSAAYQPIYMPSGAYLLKVVGSKEANRVGKYYTNNLKGGFEIMEQAVRQDFQHMPSAQWVIKSSGVTVGSPVSIMNREFEQGLVSTPDYVVNGGVVYGTGVANQGFFMNGDTLEFIKVTAPMDEKLGYKYVANDTISESLFTFNYLHDLAMDKPINTKNDLDSVVWVDKDGNATKFMLEVVADDTYGTNNEVSGVSKNLTRRVYTVKVNDATKLQNDKRYLAYDSDSKKYKVAKDAKDLFFLKENNTADGSCYYAFVKANAYPVVTVKDNAISQRNGYMALDGEYIDGAIYLASMGTYYDPIDGLSNHEGYAVNVYDDLVAAKKAIAQINVNGAGYASPAKIVALNATPVAGEVIITNLANATDYANFVNKYVVLLSSTSTKDYADYKVSVDNNTLDLVNGVLSNDNSQEVATSAFAVKRDADPLYRRFNTVNEGVATDAPDTVKFFRVNSSVKEYLYEDANSTYSKDKGFNFLGVEGKGDVKNASMYVDTAYVNRGTVMPQYLIALAPSIVKDSSVECPVCHGTDPNCDHNSFTRGYTEGRYLVNLQDSIDLNTLYNNVKVAEKYQWNRQYTRLGFVQARHLGDSLIIAKSMFTGDKTLLQPGKAATRASLDTINLANNMHKNVVFSFRIAKSGSNNFLIESETQQYDKDAKKEINVKNSKLETVKIAPEFGGWVKIQNGVPVLARGMSYNEAGLDAEVFNVEATSEKPTENEGIDATEVSIVAGNGNVTVKNAEGKTIAISNILGQSIVNTVITSDNATISVPTGIVVVSVEGEEAAKVIVK